MKEQKLLSLVRQAVQDYHMIDENDKIAIGISGGKDSLTLLYALAKLRAFYPKKFDLVAITVDLGFDNFDTSEIANYAKELGVTYHVEKTEIAKILFDIKHEDKPCSLCSRLRKGAFNDAALRFGCNKFAYAHHKDDVIDTFIMSLCNEGRVYTFSPFTKLDKTDLTLIRPLIYVPEADIISFSNDKQLPVKKNPCPADGLTKRQEARDIIKTIKQFEPAIKERIFTAVKNSGIEEW